MSIINELDYLIPVDRYEGEDTSKTFTSTEADDDTVYLHISPGEEDVVTIALSPEGAWRLIRQLAASAVAADSDE